MRFLSFLSFWVAERCTSGNDDNVSEAQQEQAEQKYLRKKSWGIMRSWVHGKCSLPPMNIPCEDAIGFYHIHILSECMCVSEHSFSCLQFFVSVSVRKCFPQKDKDITWFLRSFCFFCGEFLPTHLESACFWSRWLWIISHHQRVQNILVSSW